MKLHSYYIPLLVSIFIINPHQTNSSIISRYVGNKPDSLHSWNYKELQKKQQDFAKWHWDQTHRKDIVDEDSAREQMRRDWAKPQEIKYHGGVDLRKVATFLKETGNITSAVFDKNTGNIYFVGEKGLRYESFLTEEDIAVIYRAVFHDNYEGVSVTIDPDPENIHTWGIAKYTGGIEDTHVGQVLFEADRLLKCLSTGYDNYTGEKMEPGIKGYQPTPVRSLRYPDSETGSVWRRYWFVPESMVIDVDRKTGVLHFTKGSISIKTERMEWSGTGLITAADQKTGSPYSKSSADFARHIIDNYELYAVKYPVFYELREIAKLIAIFKWLKDEYPGRVDLSSFKRIEITESRTPVRTPALKAEYSEMRDGLAVRTLMISSGGVSFDRGYKYRYHTPTSSGGGGGTGPIPPFGDIYSHCVDNDDFSIFSINGVNYLKATIVDTSFMSYFERFVSFIRRIFSMVSHYYGKIIL